MAEKTFTQIQLRAIADALADTNEGLGGSETGHLLATCHTDDWTPTLTKRHRLYNAFAAKQNLAQNRRAILEFIRQAMMLAHDLLQPFLVPGLLSAKPASAIAHIKTSPLMEENVLELRPGTSTQTRGDTP